MTDVQKLKALAEAAHGFDDVHLAPDVVIDLVAEIERIEAENAALQQRLNTADQRVDDLSTALKYYADGDHFSTDDGLNWDSCSGEPTNILWHESEPWFIEDGWLARTALEKADVLAPATEQCQFPQSCTITCGCQPAAKDDACTSCEGSGEYHDAIGDWRGYCTCPAGVAAKNGPLIDEGTKPSIGALVQEVQNQRQERQP